MRAVGVAVAAVGLAAPTSLQSAVSPTGLHGFVRKPTPVCLNTSCDEPAPGVVLTFTRLDGLTARAITRSTGFYRVKLRPGRYTVTTVVRPPQEFTVKSARVIAGHEHRLDFFLDTGIQ